ncbi:MAG: response regulator [Candidatus Neomarinimicrobiota bacterium]|nr:MAG: response regulator [Candidatus Neomarinimicrobiota bacterium]
MRSLIVDDELTSRIILQKILSPLGECTIAVNGQEAMEAFILAKKNRMPYNLICLDIMMPGINGQTVLQHIRGIEEKEEIPRASRVKIIMTTARDDSKTIMESVIKFGCDSYILKPINKIKLLSRLKELGLI